MPETPVHHVCQEAGDVYVAVNEDSPVALVHEPFVLHAGEQEAERFFERIRLPGLERFASVQKPGEEDSQQRQGGGDQRHAHHELPGMDFERMLDPVREGVQTGQVERTSQHRQSSQYHQWGGHDEGTLFCMGSGFVPRLAEEYHPNLASHIESRKEGGNGQQPVDRCVPFPESVGQDFILRPETGKGEDTRQRQGTDDVQPEGNRHGLAQAAHVAHVAGVEDFLVVVAMSAVMG